MEQFRLLEGDRTLKDSREQINNALSTVRSLSSGTAFPTTDLTEGMLCYRTDLGRLYQLADAKSGTWTDRIAMNIAGTATNADSISWANIENKPTAYPADAHSHLYAGASTAGGSATKADALATPRTINGTPFDGTSDITIVNTIDQGGTGATTAQEALTNLGAYPKTGGELTGHLIFNTGTDTQIYKNNSEGRMILHGASWDFKDGASIYLHGKDHANAGSFDIYAHNGTVSQRLSGNADGTLKWGTSNIITASRVTVATKNSDGSITLPNGGSWTYIAVFTVANNNYAITKGGNAVAGGTVISHGGNETVNTAVAFCIQE